MYYVRNFMCENLLGTEDGYGEALFLTGIVESTVCQ